MEKKNEIIRNIEIRQNYFLELVWPGAALSAHQYQQVLPGLTEVVQVLYNQTYWELDFPSVLVQHHPCIHAYL